MAYMGQVAVPSAFEEKHYCSSRLHTACAWFKANAREVIKEHGGEGSDSPVTGDRPVRMLAAAETQ